MGFFTISIKFERPGIDQEFNQGSRAVWFSLNVRCVNKIHFGYIRHVVLLAVTSRSNFQHNTKTFTIILIYKVIIGIRKPNRPNINITVP